MTGRRTHACLACSGRTRHANQVCAACRRQGVTSNGSQVTIHLVMDTSAWQAPTRAEVDAGVDLSAMLHGVVVTGEYATAVHPIARALR